MSRWRRFRSLNSADRLLVVESAVLLALTSAGLSIASFLRVRQVLQVWSRVLPAPSDGGTGSAPSIAWAVTAASGCLPWRTTCLIESLAAEAMLMRRGKRCALRLGVRTDGERGALDAHAWIECDGAVVVGSVERLSDYAVLAEQRFSRFP